MKRKFAFIITLLLVSITLCHAQDEGKTKSSECRYWIDIVKEQPDGYMVDDNGDVKISTAEGLAWLISEVNGLNGCEPDNFNGRTVTLTNDLTMIKDTINYVEDGLDHVFTPIGNRANRFMGTFDGAGHKINWLFVLAIEDEINNRFDAGLFGYLYHGTVKNLTLNKGCLCVGSVFPEELLWFAGGFVGISDSLSLVDNCTYKMGASSCTCQANSLVGGFVGLNRNSIVRNCAYIIDWPSLHIDLNGAGLVGRNLCEGGYADAVVENSFIYGKLLGSYSVRNVGGIVCFNETIPNENGKKAIVRNCYSKLLDYLVGFEDQGCIVANNSENSVVEYCYADLSKQYYNAGLFGTNNGEAHYCTEFKPYQSTGFLVEPVVINNIEIYDMLEALNSWISIQDENIHYREWIPGGFGEWWVDVPENIISSKTAIYPNPGGDVMNIRTSLRDCTLQVYDMQGRLVHQQEITDDVTSVDASKWQSGTYIWKLGMRNEELGIKEVEEGKWVKL